MKLRLKGAQKGHSLLKKKADALTLRFRAILKKIIDVSAEDVVLQQNVAQGVSLDQGWLHRSSSLTVTTLLYFFFLTLSLSQLVFILLE